MWIIVDNIVDDVENIPVLSLSNKGDFAPHKLFEKACRAVPCRILCSAHARKNEPITVPVRCGNGRGRPGPPALFFRKSPEITCTEDENMAI